MASRDPRRVVGAQVSAKATTITNDTEYAQRYGSQQKSKILYGKVNKLANKPTHTGCVNWYLHCTFRCHNTSKGWHRLRKARVIS